MKKLVLDKKLLSRRLFLIAYDIISVLSAGFMALWSRFNFEAIPDVFLSSFWGYMPIIVAETILIFYIFRMYHSLWAYAGLNEMGNIVAACVASALFQLAIITGTDGSMPRSYFFLYLMYLGAFSLAGRIMYRLIRMKLNQWRLRKNGNAKNVMVIGAGEVGNQIIKELITSKALTHAVKCIIDDSPEKLGKFIHGIKVVGTRDFIAEAVTLYQIDQIILAMPSVKKSIQKDILMICKETNCDIKVIPSVDQLVNGEVTVNQLRDVAVEDLLGRDPVKVDNKMIGEYVKDKVVMITGGGGSIGSELCRQVARFNPKQLIIVDISENYAYEIQQEMKRKYPELQLEILIASVRNTNRMNDIMQKYHPDIIYHAAAHKHVPLMEDSPNEAVKNNVFGTYKTAEAAAKNGVKRFVMISTDKAVNPTNIMGATKRICEMIIQSFNRKYETEFVAVRFGNVLGSNGSVIPLFRKQIEEGGPVTVTHPDIVRYFMTIPEAVSLVLQAGAYAKGGEIFVLDMGEPVKILDLAKNMIHLSGYVPDEDIKIVFTGLRPGEKLYEELLMAEEGMQQTANEMIYIGKPIEFEEEEFYKGLEKMAQMAKDESGDIRAMIHELVPTYKESQKSRGN